MTDARRPDEHRIDSRSGAVRRAVRAWHRVRQALGWGPTRRARRVEDVVPVTQPMVLVSQIQRSGGTLLSQLLDDHPECFAYPHELAWGRPSKYFWPALGLTSEPNEMFDALDDPFTPTFLRSGYSKQSWHSPTRREVFPFVFDAELQRRLFASMVPNTPRAQRELLDAFLTSYFNAWLDYQNLYRPGKRFVTAFTPRVNMHAESAAGFFRDYPDGYLVSILRHPESWYESARRHDPGEYGDSSAALELWSRSLDASQLLRKSHGDRVILIVFEDLVLHTVSVMRALCGRIGLMWHSSLTVPTFNSMPIVADSSFEVRGHGVVSEAAVRLPTTEPSRRNEARWQDAIERYEASRRDCLQFCRPGLGS